MDLTTILRQMQIGRLEYESTVQDLKKASAYLSISDSAKNLLEATELYMSLMRRLRKSMCMRQ